MIFRTIALAILSATATLGHMEITYPCPRYSSKCSTASQFPPGQNIDYNMNGPIGTSGGISQPICKHTTPWPKVTDVWTAGQSVTVKFAPGGATHSGGHCQFSISYDGGNTFVVLHEELRYCFYTASPGSGGSNSVRSYSFTLPSNLPGTDHAVFAWSWVNAVGNREFYMNCGDIAIKGGAGSFTGNKMTIANYGSSYPSIPEFNGNYETGIQLYTSAPKVTVNGPGYNGDSPSTSQAPSTSEEPATSEKPTTSEEPVTSEEPSTATQDDDSCTNNTLRCSSDGKGYQFCMNQKWGTTYSCGSGTVCKTNGSGSTYCDWAN